jgi:Uma2 family endonuclease
VSAATATTLMTAEEFFEWAARPENVGAWYELVDGEVFKMPSPGELHGIVCWFVIRLLTDYLTRRGEGYLCTNDTGLVVGRDPDSVQGPDVMLYLEHKPLDQMNRGFAEDVPNLVVEVRSPSDRMRHIRRRVARYHTFGVPLVWVVEPELRAVYVYRRNELPQILDDTEELPGYGVLPDFAHKVSELFEMPGRPKPTDPSPPSA